MNDNEYLTETAQMPEEISTEETSSQSAEQESQDSAEAIVTEEVLSAGLPSEEPAEPEEELIREESVSEETVNSEASSSEEVEDHNIPVLEILADGDEPAESEEKELGEEMVEQLSLLDGQLPHLEAANAPSAHRAKAVLEGLLFVVGDEGITAEQAATALDITPELAAEYFDDLMKEYTDDSRGIEIASFGGVYRFLSKAFVHEYAKRLFQISKQATLSQAALETLAIIAYKQPITRVEIEEIRGVGADMMLRKLLARDLIKESGRSEAAGRPILYEVTEEFMNSFKLLSLKELPELPQFNTEEESEELFSQ